MKKKSKSSRDASIQAIADTFYPFIPRMSSYGRISTPGKKEYLKRKAKYAPQLLADGLTTGIVSDQANLVHGVFDDPGSKSVDVYADIHSDKFAIMQSQMSVVSVDPSVISSSEDNPSGN